MFHSRALTTTCAGALLAATSVAQRFDDIRIDTNLPAGARHSDSVQTSSQGRNVYVVWHEYRVPGAASDIFFNRSTDGGATWQANDTRLDTDVPGAFESRFPRISCSNSNVYVVWEDNRGQGNHIYFNRSTDSGATWPEQDRRVDNAPADAICSDPRLSSAADCELPASCSAATHRVYVVWSDDRNEREDIFFNYSSSSGAPATWRPADQRLDTDLPFRGDSRTPQISCLPGQSGFGVPDQIYVVWSDTRGANPPLPFADVRGLAPHPTPGMLYGSDPSVDRILTIDVPTAGATSLPGSWTNVAGMAFGAGSVFGAGTFAFGNTRYLIQIDHATGTPVRMDPLAQNPPQDVQGLAFDPTTQTLYGSMDELIITIDWQAPAGGFPWAVARSSANGQPMGPMGFELRGLAFDPATGRLYGTNDADQLVSIQTTPGPLGQSPRVGQPVVVGPIGFDNVEGLAFDAATSTLYGSQTATPGFQPQILEIDPATGQGRALPGLGHSVFFNRSIATTPTNERIWESDQRVDRAPPTATPSNPQIASAQGDVYVVWQDDRNGNQDVFFNRLVRATTQFEPTDQRLDGGIGDSIHPQICCEPACLVPGVCAENFVYVVWQDDRNGSWDVYFNRSRFNGINWQTLASRIDRDAGVADSIQPSIACRDSEVYIAWQDDRNGGPDEDIYFRYSLNEGSTFSEPADLRLDRPLGNSRSPQVGVSSDGPYVVWLDDRDGGVPQNDDVYFNIPFGFRPFLPVSIPLSPAAASVTGTGLSAMGSQVEIQVTGGSPNGTILLAVGFQRIEQPIEGLLGPLLIFDIPFLAAFQLDTFGRFSYPLAIPGPPNGAFLGLTPLFWQAGAFGITPQGGVIIMTNGLEMWIG